MITFRHVALLTTAFFASTFLTNAEPITYTISGLANGEFYVPSQGYEPAGTFQDFPFSFVLTADTANVYLYGHDEYSIFQNAVASFIPLMSATLNLGADTTNLGPTFGLEQFAGYGAVSLYRDDETYHSLFDFISTDPNFKNYGLTTDVGPVSVGALKNPNSTTPGAYPLPVDFNGIDESVALSLSDVTFEAQLTSPTPEPASLALICLGVFGLGVVRRRRNLSRQ